jgi:hypothetical protein
MESLCVNNAGCPIHDAVFPSERSESPRAVGAELISPAL